MKNPLRRSTAVIGIAVMLAITAALAFLSISSLSYFYVAFKEPLSVDQAIDFLKDNEIDPKRHMVAIEGSVLQDYNSIYTIDIGEVNGKQSIQSMAFYTRFYALKALFDSRIEWWSIKGPRNPYD